MISVLTIGSLYWSSQPPINRETGYSNVLPRQPPTHPHPHQQPSPLPHHNHVHHYRPLVTSYCRKPSQGSMARIASAEDVRLEDSNAFSTVVWSGQCQGIRIVKDRDQQDHEDGIAFSTVIWCPTLFVFWGCFDWATSATGLYQSSQRQKSSSVMFVLRGQECLLHRCDVITIINDKNLLQWSLISKIMLTPLVGNGVEKTCCQGHSDQVRVKGKPQYNMAKLIFFSHHN